MDAKAFVSFLFGAYIVSHASVAFAADDPPIFFIDDFSGTQLDATRFNDLDGAFVVEDGEIRRDGDEGVYSEDRHYLTSARSDYLSRDWVFEVTVHSPTDGPPDILFIGLGSGRPDPTYVNEPANGLMFRIHQGWIDGRVDVAGHPTNPEFTYFAEAVGALPMSSDRFTVRLSKRGNSMTFVICERPADRASDSRPCAREIFHRVVDVDAAAPFLDSGNAHLFFGNGSGSYAFEEAAVRPLGSLPERTALDTLHPEPDETLPIGENRPQFGYTLAVRNDVALIGMPTHVELGRIAVFKRLNGIWRREGSLPCPPRACLFAEAVVLRDNIAVVAGLQSVLVFRRERGEWRLKEQIDPPGGRPSDPTQSATALPRSVQYQDGLVTAAYLSNDAPGSLYVYELDAAARVKRQIRLSASDVVEGDNFGHSVSMARDTIIVGSPDDRRGGSVYVFRRRGGDWVETQKLQASDHAAGNTFGLALAINKGHILVGAPNIDRDGTAHLGNERGGSVYHFAAVDGMWEQQAKLRPTTQEFPNYTDFGSRIVMFGERAIIGATPTPSAPPGEGVVFEYVRTEGNFRPISVARTRSRGGVALSNQILMLGSPWEDVASGIGHVALYALNRSPAALRYCEGQQGATFCDDFTSGAADRWQTEGGMWSVENQEYVGRGAEDVCGTGFSTNQARIPGLAASDVDVSVSIRSLERVDKGLVLRSTNPGDQIELNFRADPFNDLIVQELRDCQFVMLESGFALPHAMEAKNRFRARLVGRHLSVWMNGRLVISRSFPFAATSGAVGMSVIEGGLASFDNVRVDVLR